MSFPVFKCTQCGGLKPRPGRCYLCRKLPVGFEPTSEAGRKLMRQAQARRGKRGKEGACG